MIYNKDTKLILSISSKPGSFGTIFHNYLYEQMNLNYMYKSCSCENLEDAIKGIRSLNIYGCSVSMPFKNEVIQYLDNLDESAEQINAVNTIINKNGTLTGYNTDYFAIEEISKKYPIKDSILIIGGGAIAKMLIQFYDKNNLYLWCRNQEKLKSILADNKSIKEYTDSINISTVINATPLNLNQLDIHLLDKALTNADLIINYPIFDAEYNYKKILPNQSFISGLELTFLQAKEQFQLYTDSNNIPKESLENAQKVVLSQLI